MHDLDPEEIFQAVEETQKSIQGSYAALALLANRGVLAFMDPHGIRPMGLGKRVTGRVVRQQHNYLNLLAKRLRQRTCL